MAADTRARTWRTTFALLLGAYVATHLATITISRLAWFDDSFFASVADSVRRTGRFTLEVSPLWIDKPIYLYGPVYIVTLATMFEAFGLGIVQTRLPGLLSGFGILVVAYLILRRAGLRTVPALGAGTLLALDPTFHQSIHSGRTDSMAMLFLLSSFLLLLDRGREEVATWRHAASGGLAALGVLTTPRPGYLAIPMGMILAWRWVRRPDRRRAQEAVVWGGVSLACLAAWVVWAFGGVSAMLAYFADFSDTYAGGGFGVRAIHTPILLPLLAVVAALIVVRPGALAHELVFFCLSGIIGFYVFVRDKGAFGGLYAFFMVPLAYLALGYGLSRLRETKPASRSATWLHYGVVGGLLAFNGGIFAARSALEFLQRGARDPATAATVIARAIPPGSRVVGDDKYYFAVRQAGSDFQYLQRGGTPEQRAAYHEDTYGMEFLVTSEPGGSPLLAAYANRMELVPVASIPAPPEGAVAQTLTHLAHKAGVGTSVGGSYAGTIFARTR